MALPPIQIPPKVRRREAVLVGEGTVHTIALPTDEEAEVSSFESDSDELPASASRHYLRHEVRRLHDFGAMSFHVRQPPRIRFGPARPDSTAPYSSESTLVSATPRSDQALARRSHSLSNLRIRSLPNQQPIEFQHVGSIPYTFLSPVFTLDEDTGICNHEALFRYQAYARDQHEGQEGRPQQECALIIHQSQPIKAFVMRTYPRRLLEPGAIITCFGGLEGKWRLTDQHNKLKGGVYGWVVNEDTRQMTWLRMDGRIKLPTWGSKVRATLLAVRSAVRTPRTRTTSTTLFLHV
ncbi:hypothetical protein C8R44DRAFT_743759 [Mycena epipterygia]|nr:hypothetical protein C8R44DRAFT_743759 [Mycena epipterygia]